MKILNRSQFLKLPSGVVYSRYESLGIISGLELKGESLVNDWCYQNLISSVDANDSDEFLDIMRLAEENYANEFTFDLDAGERDGFFDVDNLFLVYDKEDVQKLVNKLNTILLN